MASEMAHFHKHLRGVLKYLIESLSNRHRKIELENQFEDRFYRPIWVRDENIQIKSEAWGFILIRISICIKHQWCQYRRTLPCWNAMSLDLMEQVQWFWGRQGRPAYIRQPGVWVRCYCPLCAWVQVNGARNATGLLIKTSSLFDDIKS